MAKVNIYDIASSLRRKVFFLLDLLRGGPVKKHYNEIKYIIEHPADEEAVRLKEKYLNDLLDHAAATTPFYSRYQGRKISGFPVIDKNIIRADSREFISAGKRYSPFTEVVTSGSTGTPFRVVHDKRKRDRNTADTIFFGEAAGFEFGSRLYYFKIWNKINRKSRLRTILENIVPYDVTVLDNEAMKAVHNRLIADRSPRSLLGYASFFDALAAWLRSTDSQPVNNNTRAIIAMSEAFDPHTKESISYYYNAKAVSRYSNVENGIIAQQQPGEPGDFIINEAGYYVEILDFNRDEPVEPGKTGRIVITDLFNYCMPMIRYDTGDAGICEKPSDRRVLRSIEGRRMEMIFDTSGSHVSSFVITNNMWKYIEVRQYQFIQESEKEYLFKLNADLPFARENELIEEFRSYFGKDSVIRVVYVNEIPLLDSGKRRKVMNLWRIGHE